MNKGALYKIGDVATLLGVKPSVIRYWEKEFPQLSPKRTTKKQRLYTEKMLSLIKTIHQLLYVQGLTIEGARRALLEKNVHVEKKILPKNTTKSIVQELEELRSILVQDITEKQ